MSEVEKTGKKIIVTCDCGAVHKVSINDDKELKINSTFKKHKEETDEEKRIRLEKEAGDKKDPFFDD